MAKTVIKIENLSKIYRLGEIGTGTISHDLNRWWNMNIRRKEDPFSKVGHVNDRTAKAQKGELVAALNEINLEVKQGDILGVIGRNGAGKSTLLKILSRVTSPTTGSIKTLGRMASLLEVGTGFHPEMTGRENIYMNGTIMGMRKWEIDKQLEAIVDFAGVAKYLDTPVKRYSSGMTVRLGFAIAAHLEPEILVVDEVLAVGDAEFQKKAIGKMQDVSKNDGRTVLFVSHNMAAVKSLCNTGIVLENGTIKMSGTAEEAISHYHRSTVQNMQNSIIEKIEYFSKSVTIDEITINGKNQNNIIINKDKNSIDLIIKGFNNAIQKIALEVKLHDENDVVLAFFSPNHKTGITKEFQNGFFEIENTIQLPKGISKGTYYISICLTNPMIEYYLEINRAIQVDAEGYPTDTGFVFEYSKGHGWLFLH